MSPSVIYQWVLCGPDGDEAMAVSVLDDCFLCALAAWLESNFEETEASGRVLGICLVEQARRFARNTPARRHNLGGQYP